MTNNNLENRIYDLIARRMTGESAGDFTELDQLLKENPSFQFLYDQMILPDEPTVPTEDQIDGSYATHYIGKLHLPGLLEDKTTKKKSKYFFQKFPHFTYTSLIAFLLVGLFFLFNNSDKNVKKAKGQQTNIAELSTPKAAKSKIILPDGTIVFLNADSKITYEKQFAGAFREINLTGEAFFDVKHDSKRPFIIHTQKADIKVLGTAFNVKSYAGDNLFETALIRGKIEVSVKSRPGEKFIVKPNEKLIITDNNLPKKVNEDKKSEGPFENVSLTNLTVKDSMVAETSWIDNRLVFVNESLSNISKQLERRFNVSVIFKTNRTLNYRYTGVYEDSDLEEIFRILSKTRKIDYKINNDSIVIE